MVFNIYNEISGIIVTKGLILSSEENRLEKILFHTGPMGSVRTSDGFTFEMQRAPVGPPGDIGFTGATGPMGS